MSQTVCPIVSADDRVCLDAIIADRNRAQKHVTRARIVLHSADRLTVAAVARLAGVSRPAVWRWQRRFAEAGVDGLLRDATRKPGKPPVPADVVQQMIALTCSEPPGEATHWTGRAMAKVMDVSLRTVQRIWQAHKLQPHRLRTSQGHGMARASSPLDLPFHPDLRLLAERLESFFSALTRQRLKRGVFHSVVDLQAAIKRYIDQHNDDPKPFSWTKPAAQIIGQLNPLNASMH